VGVPTKTLADAVAAEGSLRSVAWLFEIAPRSVRPSSSLPSRTGAALEQKID
jgi:hypothetical protein